MKYWIAAKAVLLASLMLIPFLVGFVVKFFYLSFLVGLDYGEKPFESIVNEKNQHGI